MDPYFLRPEVSNSDLSWLKNKLYPRPMPDPDTAFAFGSLIDAMVTEPTKVNFFKRTLDDKTFSREDFEKAEKMKRSFYADQFCQALMEFCEPQKVMAELMDFNYHGIKFQLNTRCKWDFWKYQLGWGADLKSTTATTQQQFEAACKYFCYDRQRAFYMDIAGSEKDVLIGVSKVNFKVFKVFIDRKSEFYLSGKDQYTYLAFRWYLLFGENV